MKYKILIILILICASNKALSHTCKDIINLSKNGLSEYNAIIGNGNQFTDSYFPIRDAI